MQTSFWIVALVLYAVIMLLRIAITGKIHSGGRGVPRVVTSVKSLPWRIAMVSLALVLLILLAYSLRKFGWPALLK
jgi:hypothetical protein